MCLCGVIGKVDIRTILLNIGHLLNIRYISFDNWTPIKIDFSYSFLFYCILNVLFYSAFFPASMFIFSCAFLLLFRVLFIYTVSRFISILSLKSSTAAVVVYLILFVLFVCFSIVIITSLC